MENALVGVSGLKSIIARPDVESRFKSMLGNRTPQFFSSLISAVSSNKYLADADQRSVISAAAIAATLDLPINQNLGFAHIVSYSGKAQFQMGWKGFVQLAMRTGQYKTMNCTVVHDGDIITHNRITGEMVFSSDDNTDKPKVGYVAYYRLLNGFEKYYYMTIGQAESHGRRYSKSYNSDSGRWKTDFDSMALKTVMKMLLSKFGMLSVEMQAAIESDQAVVNGDGTTEYGDNQTAFEPLAVPGAAETGAVTEPEKPKHGRKPKQAAPAEPTAQPAGTQTAESAATEPATAPDLNTDGITDVNLFD